MRSTSALTRLPKQRMSTCRETVHRSVLPAETLQLLAPKAGETWVDCTIGGGGHARMILDAIGPQGRLIGFDQDETMLATARAKLPGATLVSANFDQIADVLANLGVSLVDGVLADLGFSSDQMDDPGRGLSFLRDGPLDMRFDCNGGMTAAEIVNTWSEQALADTIFENGEERHSRRIARRIVERRREKPFETTADLAAVIERSVPRSADTRRIHPATRTFQALRIAVNDELSALDRLLNVLPHIVKGGGRAGIISFHSLEDRRVKQAFRESTWTVLTKKPVEAGDAEVAMNPRSRSAKLRVAKRN